MGVFMEQNSSSSNTAVSSMDDWSRLANAFKEYGQLVSYYVPSTSNSQYAQGSNKDGPLAKFREIAQEIVDCGINNNYEHYFSELELKNSDVEKVLNLANGMATICERMHVEVMQNVDNHVFKSLENIYDVTNKINEGDDEYIYGTHEETVTTTVRGETYTYTKTVANDLEYYMSNEDTGIGELYEAFEKVKIEELEKYQPEGYEETIKGLKDNTTSLYIGSVGAYNKKLDEDDWRNYMLEIAIGLTVVATIAIVIVTAGTALPVIMGAVGLAGLSGVAGFGATVAVGAAYGAVVGLGIGAAYGTVAYTANTALGKDGYALDGTYLSDESKSAMFKEFVTTCAKVGSTTGAMVGASGAGWLAETAIDGFDLVRASIAGDGVGIAVGLGSLLLSGDDIIKSVRKATDAVSGAKGLDNIGIVKNVDDMKKMKQIQNDFANGKLYGDNIGVKIDGNDFSAPKFTTKLDDGKFVVKADVDEMEFNLDIGFKCKVGHNTDEFGRQIKLQNEALNEMTVEEYLIARKNFNINKRSPGEAKLRADFRKKMLDEKIDELINKGMAEDIAIKEAEKWIADYDVLHRLDMIAGGKMDDIAGLGHDGVNRSIGGQWRSRVKILDDAIEDFIKANPGADLSKVKLNVNLLFE